VNMDLVAQTWTGNAGYRIRLPIKGAHSDCFLISVVLIFGAESRNFSRFVFA